jgi:hypothetical protein
VHYFLEQLASFLEQEASFFEQLASAFCSTAFLEHVPPPHFWSGPFSAMAAPATTTEAKAMMDLSFMMSPLLNQVTQRQHGVAVV